METCADCGKPISPNEASYVTTDPWGKGGPSKYHHSACGDPLGIKSAVAAERAKNDRLCRALEEIVRLERYGNLNEDAVVIAKAALSQ